jgi:ring-1,2-phenylacetyl-CoA epoxidase subunit PaaC
MATPAHTDYLLRLGDSALILGQRLSEWCGHGPILEEDLALTNIALDLIGQARLLLSHAGNVEGLGRDEDQLAFLRPESQFRNVTLVELPNGDFGDTTMRNFLFFALQAALWPALEGSTDAELAGIAAKSAKETRYHLAHAADWVVRLGDGTAQSHARVQAALDRLWPYAAEFFVDVPGDEVLADQGVGVPWSTLQPAWEATVVPVLHEATLTIPAASPFRSRGKFGVHSEHMGHLLAEMQYLQRTYPGARW